MKTRTGMIGLGCALFLASAMSAQAAGILLSVTGEFEDFGAVGEPSTPDEFGILNNSDSGVRIAWITIDMSNADANFEDFADPQPHFPRFDTRAGCSPDYCYGEELGYPVAGGLGTALTGFLAPTEAQQDSWEEGVSITLNFDHFDAGEFFFFTTDVDDMFDFRMSGREFAFSTLTVHFVGDGLPTEGITLTANYGADPENFWRAVTRVEREVIPVPAGVWLLVSGLAALGLRRRRS